ncbi:MAG: hypothetical protein WCD44_02650 [Candidatus Babeliales bacterium]
MKTYKKGLILVGLAIVSTTVKPLMFQKEISTEEISSELDSLYNGIAEHNISKNQATQTLGGLRKYVQKNGQGNEKLLNASEAIADLTDDLVTGYMTGWGAVSPDFNRHVRNVEDAIEVLKNDPWWFGKKREVRAVLLNVGERVLSLMPKTKDVYGSKQEVTIEKYQ